MIALQRHQWANQPIKQPRYHRLQNAYGEFRKKIQNYSYSVNDQIGKGYSSTVYKGSNDMTGAVVAIKVIQLKSLRDNIARQMLETEIQCFKETKHPNILSYQNSFFTVNNCYIITEYCSGGDLSKLIKQKKGFGEEEAQKMFLQIFKGYESFYKAGFIHRDLKPANIFITGDQQLKIADFGFSKRRTSNQREVYNVGTPVYMPLESLTANTYNEKTEVWALGIILYEIIFGSVPFRGKTEQDLVRQIQLGNIIFPENKMVSCELKDFVRRCLESNTLNRFTIQQMKNHAWMQKLLQKEKPSTVSYLPNDNHLQEQAMMRHLNTTPQQRHLKQQFFNKSVELIPKAKVSFNPQTSPKVSKASISVSTLPSRNNYQYSPDKTKMKITKPIQFQQKGPKEPMQKIIRLINYLRLNYKINDKVNEVTKQIQDFSMKQELEKLTHLLKNHLISNMNAHLKCSNSKQNNFKLNDKSWSQFISSEHWQLYVCTVNKYEAKYSHLTNQDELKLQYPPDSWKRCFMDVYKRLNQICRLKVQTQSQTYALYQLLYLFFAFAEITDDIAQNGWDHFSEAENELLEKISVNFNNYQQITERLKIIYQNNKKSIGNDRF